MYKLFCFLKRDFLVFSSYRLRIVLTLSALPAAVFLVFFLGKTFSGGMTGYLSRYGNDYFAFALLGMCVSTFVSTGLYSLAAEVRGAQVQGTLEALLATPVSPNLLLFGNSLWSFVQSLVQSIVYLVLTIVISGIPVTPVKIILVALVLMLTFICFLSLGMISAAYILVFKQGNPVNFIFGTSSFFFGGLLFPVEVLPPPLRLISFFLPMSHAATAVREILLVENGQGEWLTTLVWLILFSVLLLPAGFALLRLALSRAKKEGSLVQF